MQYTYTPTGICSRQINIEIDDESETIKDISFFGGCDGNHKGIVALSKGKTLDEVISSLKGIKCGMRNTSCPDQLARALEQIKEEI